MAGYIGKSQGVTQVDGYNRSEADTRYVNTTGDTMTGDLVTPMVVANSALSNRNLVINGAMQVWQRGTSQTINGSYAADRFWMGGAASASRSTDVPAGFTYSTKLTYSAAAMNIGQPIELVATGNSAPMVAGQQVTLSFYAKVDSGTEDFNAAIYFRDAKFSGTNQVAFIADGGNSFTATTTWQRFVKTFTVPTVNGTNVLAGPEVGNIEKDFYITGIQLEAGDTATPFEHRSYGQELALCQRYYTRWQPKVNSGATSFPAVGFGYASTTGSAGYNVSLPSSMRATPTVSFSGTISAFHGGASATLSSVGTVYEVSNSGFWITTTMTTSPFTVGDAGILYVQNSTANYFEASAEL